MGEMDGAVAGITKWIHFQIYLLVTKRKTIKPSKTAILTLTIASILSEKQTDTRVSSLSFLTKRRKTGQFLFKMESLTFEG